MALPEHLAELERKFSVRLSEALAKTRQDLRRAVAAEAQRASTAMLAELDAIPTPVPQGLLAEEELAELTRVAGGESRRAFARDLREALLEFDRARTQASVLEALLASVQSFGDHAAVWLMRPTELVGWASRGFAGDPIAGRTLPHDASPALARLATGTGCALLSVAEAAQVAHALEIAAPARALFIPLVLRDRIAAALYLDAAAAGEFEVEALQMLTLVAAQRLELQALATRSYTPTLFLDSEAPASERGLALWDPADSVSSGTPGTPASLADPTSPQPEARTQAPAAGGTPAMAALAAAAVPGVAAAQSAWRTNPEPTFDTAAGSGIETFEKLPAEEEPATLVEVVPTLTSSVGLEMPPNLPEAAAEEISWQMEEADETALLGSSGPSATPTAESAFATPEPASDRQTATGFDLSAAAAASAAASAASSEWREVEDATAPHPTYSPAATQRFAVPAITHEIPAPESLPTADFATPIPPPAVPPASDIADDATVRIQRVDLEPPPAALAPPAPAPTIAVEPTPPAPPAITPPAIAAHADDEPTVARARTTEVAPPADLQGPGWAFSSARSPRASGDNALHEEARRLARLLVSEIKLYNEDQVEEGRHNRDIYHRLKDDIDRSRQIYEERVHESVRGTTDYFQQELIRSLAAGDPRALGI
jgi:hypothetical protein